jgi:hypothetical protein
MTGRLGGLFGRQAGSERPLANPFAVLGLDSGADLTDDEVRAVWRLLAAATHPDRADGGDPERFAAAAAAYTDLRTRAGRGEARAALARVGDRPELARGRPARLALRVVAAAATATIAVLISGPGPAGPALATGAVTWLILTARHDLGSLRRDGRGAGRQPGSGPVATGRDGSDDHADHEPT